MLISMPTGTSTIFGAFQAILALLLNPDELRPLIKVARAEKFASEIFYNKRAAFMLHCSRNSRLCAGDRQNNVGINGFIGGAANPEADANPARRIPDKEVVRWHRRRSGSRQKELAKEVATDAQIFLQHTDRR
jgi:hypothetical protein